MGSKSWCATLHDYTKEDYDFFLNFAHEDCTRATIGKEITATTGRPHLQMAFALYKTRRDSSLRKLNKRVHWEPMKAKHDDGEAAFAYCRKEGNFVDIDNRNPGARTDLSAAQVAVQQRIPPATFAFTPGVSHPALKHYLALLPYLPGRKTEDPLTVRWWWGPTGGGKSEEAFSRPDYYEPLSFQWWCGYTHQHTIILDEFRADFCSFHDLLRLLNRYPQTRQTKFGRVNLDHREIIITCPYRPETIYHTNEDLNQLLRRIHEVRYFEPCGGEHK